MFVDGLRLARVLSQESFDVLSRLRIPHEYRDSDASPTRRLRCDDPVLIMDADGGLLKIRCILFSF